MYDARIMFLSIGLVLSMASSLAGAEATLPPLKDGIAPKTVEEAWTGFDPRKEPLDVEVLKEWEEDGVVVKVIRLRVGVFKGKKAMLAAVYGYPKGAENLPGLVQIHGGGQSAQSSFVVKDAKNGYATISIAWAGRIISTNYTVTNKEKEMFWTGNTESPDYRVTTDWGAVDAYHHHCRFKGNNFVQNPPGGKHRGSGEVAAQQRLVSGDDGGQACHNLSGTASAGGPRADRGLRDVDGRETDRTDGRGRLSDQGSRPSLWRPQ